MLPQVAIKCKIEVECRLKVKRSETPQCGNMQAVSENASACRPYGVYPTKGISAYIRTIPISPKHFRI